MDTDLLRFMQYPIKYEQIVWVKPLMNNPHSKIQYLCQLPYPDHPEGCPNYNNNRLCPPNSPNRRELLHSVHYFMLFMVRFDFKRYKAQMQSEHPLWTEKQCACNLYYQNTIKKQLFEYVSPYFVLKNQLLMGCGSGFGKNIYSMESIGINVFQTLKNIGYHLETKPVNEITFVSLLASLTPIRKKFQTKLTMKT